MVNLNRYRDTISNFENNLKEISKDIKKYLDNTVNLGKDFGGPSVYFHKMALLEYKENYLNDNHLKMIYAVMPSWGMHRMGSKGAKMVGYNIFKNEILKNKEEILELKEKNYTEVNINNIIKLLLEKIHVSTSNSYLVSSSKVLHHILPNIISPIDRNYTLRFMKYNKKYWGSKSINVNNEEAYANIFFDKMYSFINENKNTMEKYIIQINENNIYSNNINTSLIKIFDNLIMAYIKDNKGEIFE